ncbi:stalk domain-containing protein [Cellulosilyticum sp. I15G10I2]|uniref:stalk domain-containing protein n=1 Tax=Cellulosilyticum sp. I15G10I2 TaxID=1892843 RepID=UPI001A9A63E7|nr:stalk domain-containing protein [Cellulosilyticum sp. I15G10I2]
MNRIKSCIKAFLVYAVGLTVLLSLSLIAFSGDIYGSDHVKKKVAIKTYNGKYLSAENGGAGLLTVNREKTGEKEIFQLMDIGKGYIALIAYNGDYLRVINGGKNVAVSSGKIDQWNTFQLVKLGNNKIALKTHNKKYIGAEDGGSSKVVADRKKIGDWETFELIEIGEDEIISDQCILTAVSSDKSVSFTWSKPNSTKDIIGYNLYRGTTSGRYSSTPVTDFPIKGTAYTDENIESGTTYYYVVKAVYKDKTLGSVSNEVAVVLKSRINLSAQAEEEGIYLFWSMPNSTKDIIGYNLYRGTSSGRQSSTPITDFPVKGTSYIDKNVEYSATYYYILKVVYRDQTLGATSNEVVVKTGTNNLSIVLEVGSRYMLVGGQRKEIDPGKGTAMIMKNGRTFLPIKAVVESMGGEVIWDALDKKVSIYLKTHKIYLWIGNKTAKVNGVNKETDVAPYISEGGRTMLPLRFIVENLNCDAEWDGIIERVTIKVK